jgi:hypothetical protein
MTKEFRKEFMVDREHTGREIVTFFETGKSYCIEWIEPRSMKKKGWGDINPATGKVEGSYGNKYRGAIKEDESMITKENGFDEIVYGTGSPYTKIHAMHEIWKTENGY